MARFRLFYILLASATFSSAMHSPRSDDIIDEIGGSLNEALLLEEALTTDTTPLDEALMTDTTPLDEAAKQAEVEQSVRRATAAVDFALSSQSSVEEELKNVGEGKQAAAIAGPAQAAAGGPSALGGLAFNGGEAVGEKNADAGGNVALAGHPISGGQASSDGGAVAGGNSVGGGEAIADWQANANGETQTNAGQAPVGGQGIAGAPTAADTSLPKAEAAGATSAKLTTDAAPGPCDAQTKKLRDQIKNLQSEVKTLKKAPPTDGLPGGDMPVPWPTSRPTVCPPVNFPTNAPTYPPKAPPVPYPTPLPTQRPTEDKDLPPPCRTPEKCKLIKQIDEDTDEMEAGAAQWRKLADFAKESGLKKKIQKKLLEREQIFKQVTARFGDAPPCKATPKMKAKIKTIVKKIEEAKQEQIKSEVAKKPAVKAAAKKKAIKDNEDVEEFTLDIFSEGAMTEGEAELILTPLEERLKRLGVTGHDFHRELRRIEQGRKRVKREAGSNVTSSNT
eukprot:TRINITY_DN600_c0_g2_i1.p1 TRINITY_DN600_c0_g2~~TRINITY_DN600_c0_g2_i1.p1  ORF type:complete len:505 (-),score=123.67 TRINITY_DN600_c0_g2_i1:126-1640(-)